MKENRRPPDFIKDRAATMSKYVSFVLKKSEEKIGSGLVLVVAYRCI